tara:strand:- start:443 stop:823 length:381 start_codon:yes stop_codon:yes gene_type:complete
MTKNLIIDAATDKILFIIMIDKKSYTSEHTNSRENFDKFTLLLLNFLKKNKIKLEEINNVFVNQGPGKFTGIRTSVSVVKALNITNKLSIYGFNSEHVKDYNYEKMMDLFKKGLLIKNLINPRYSS